MKVLVLGGGDSPEREVSLSSAKNVAEAARAAGFEVEEHDPIKGLDLLDDLPVDTIIFPILHGAGGEDGVLQAELEKRRLPYLGSDSVASDFCWDKWRVLQELQKNNLPTARSTLVTVETFTDHELATKPYVLKVVHGGSSIGVLIARDPKKVNQIGIDEIFKMESPVILEELVAGTEITVSLLDGKALPVLEIIPPAGAEFNYENKYNGTTQEICPPKTVSEETQKRARNLSEQVYKICGCRHLARIDMMVEPNGELKIFDVNTMPGLTIQSLYPKSAKVAGLNMPGLVRKLVKLVKRDFQTPA